MAAAELEENRPVVVDLAGTQVMLLKQKDTIYALGNVCSHLSGPLSEGKIMPGCVECPWHASRFDIASGSVIDGPATFPQPVFDVQVADGQIQLRTRASS